MAKERSALSVRLFYSYSHKDDRFREDMEKTLRLLQRDGLLSQWSDTRILPGKSISTDIEEKISQADIIAYLFSPDFIDSEECNREWKRGQDLASADRLVFRIPIILRPCAWQDFLAEDDVKALPLDGKPVSSYDDQDVARQEVYEGIKTVVQTLRSTFTPKPSFLAEIQHTDFASTTTIALEDVFTFPRLTLQPHADTSDRFNQKTIDSVDDLRGLGRCLLHGPDKAGKTALARFIHLSLISANDPTLLVDLSQLDGRLTDSYLRSQYSAQFHGDYALWKQRPNKTLILDNLTEAPRLADDIADLAEDFPSIFVTLSSDTFHAFYKDETRLADFAAVRIEPLTHVQQEALIRKRLALLDAHPSIEDGLVDRVEDHVNSVILSNRIMPRYPFFVLSILQTYESYMPRNIAITSYGHCYYILIVASLTRAGISDKDDSVNSAFNFAEELAFALYSYSTPEPTTPFSFDSFVSSYKDRFFIRTSLINRLQHPDFGLLNDSGLFRTDYMYYFFLGKYLASHSEQNRGIIEYLCEYSHQDSQYLTLLFTIHHTPGDEIISEILDGISCALPAVNPATLSPAETRRFYSLVSGFSNNVLSEKTVEEERRRDREIRDSNDEERNDGSSPGSDENELGRQLYRILKNNQIMGQVLRNRHGNLEKAKIESIIELIVDGSLRIVNTVLKDEEEISKLASYIKAQEPNADVEQVRQFLRLISFLWTIDHIEGAVDAINVPDISRAIKAVVRRKGTPAYDIVGYFSELNSAERLTEKERDSLLVLVEKYSDLFVKWVLSVRTQMYMNTHHSSERVEQSVCAALEIPYSSRRVAKSSS